MAINKIAAPLSTGPSVFAQPVLNQLAALLTDCNHGTRVSGGYVKAGSLWNIGGAMFLADSDTAITGTRSAATTGVKFTISGNSATVSYGSDAVTWNGSYQGYYDTSSNYYYCGYATAGETILSTYTYDDDGSNLSYHKVFGYKINDPGYYRIVTTATGDFSNTIEYCRIYINDTAVGTELSSSTTAVSQTEDIFCEQGDIIQLYSHRSKDNDIYTHCSIQIKTGQYGIVS